jgi:regulator of replication initiation timing
MKQSTRGPNDLEERIEYLTNQNEFLKKKLRESVQKNKILEEEYERLLEENNNIRIVRNQGKVL